MRLTSENVELVASECLHEELEAPDAIIVKGIVRNYAFHLGRLQGRGTDIRSMLRQLPGAFHRGTGDGHSFLQACEDRDGSQWTGEHRLMEALFCLGLGVGVVTECLPREFWPVLPGGMPYYAVDTGLPPESEFGGGQE